MQDCMHVTDNVLSSCRVCSTDENCFVSGDENGVVRFWDRRKADPVHSFSHHSDGISDMVAHPSEAAVLAASADGCISALDLKKLQASCCSYLPSMPSFCCDSIHCILPQQL